MPSPVEEGCTPQPPSDKTDPNPEIHNHNRTLHVNDIVSPLAYPTRSTIECVPAGVVVEYSSRGNAYVCFERSLKWEPERGEMFVIIWE